eukprot:CCRYP_011728-RA/>CCRYP_011728-RA protein AED:0.45 eAED:0.45 QI:0/-1/0/1/-1/1/1/0/134
MFLAPLTSLVGECGHTKVTEPRARETPMVLGHASKAFDDVKTSIAKDVVLAYPDYSMQFEIYTDDSSKQLGSVITQGIGLALQQEAVNERKEVQRAIQKLLAIVETLKEFKGMLWGQRLKVYTDHKNLIQDASD